MQRTRSKNRKSILLELKKLAQEKNLDLSKLIDYETGSPTPLGYIIYKTKDLKYLNYKPGEVLIRKQDGNSPFNDRIVQIYHEYLRTLWKPRKVDVRIGLPCTSIKPYSKSVTHRMMNYYVNTLRTKCKLKVEIISISEPMLIVPQKYEELFPLSNYDFPPKLMEPHEKEQMITMLANVLPKVLRTTKREVIFVLPQHHYDIVTRALNILNINYLTGLDQVTGDNDNYKIKIIGYGRLAFRTLHEIFIYLCNKYCKNNCKTNKK